MKILTGKFLTGKCLTGVFWCLMLAPVLGGACGKGTGRAPSGGLHPSPPESAPTPVPAQVQVHGGADLPFVCNDYRRKLLRCMESSHFPETAKKGQRLALDQMLAIVRHEQRRRDEPGAAAAAAIENCRDSLSTLEESSKITCPGAL
ncbi:MAG: hypothetical protein H7X95_10550 [Deltaproteobacteria bacterium]|nr:hypothetical protein [Deltaproteobacteria bacterium]